MDKQSRGRGKQNWSEQQGNKGEQMTSHCSSVLGRSSLAGMLDNAPIRWLESIARVSLVEPPASTRRIRAGSIEAFGCELIAARPFPARGNSICRHSSPTEDRVGSSLDSYLTVACRAPAPSVGCAPPFTYHPHSDARRRNAGPTAALATCLTLSLARVVELTLRVEWRWHRTELHRGNDLTRQSSIDVAIAIAELLASAKRLGSSNVDGVRSVAQFSSLRAGALSARRKRFRVLRVSHASARAYPDVCARCSQFVRSIERFFRRARNRLPDSSRQATAPAARHSQRSNATRMSARAAMGSAAAGRGAALPAAAIALFDALSPGRQLASEEKGTRGSCRK
jgi:hypothetical protein